jgi:hypothetical protein
MTPRGHPRRSADPHNLNALAAIGGFVAAIASSVSACTAWWALRAEQRGWIGPPEITTARSRTEPEVSFTFTFKNTGHSPTRGLYIGATVVDGAHWPERVDTICQSGKRAATTETNFYNWSSIPDAPFVISRVPERDFQNIPISELIGDNYVVGCVVYGDQIGSDLHKTGFVASLQIEGQKVSVASIIRHSTRLTSTPWPNASTNPAHRWISPTCRAGGI